MKVFGIIVLIWFMITLLVLPYFGNWDFDIWQTEDYNEIIFALSTPIEVLTGIGAWMEDIKVSLEDFVDTSDTGWEAWDDWYEWSPLYWLYEVITGKWG